MNKNLFSVAALLCLSLFTAAGAQAPARRAVKSKVPAAAPAATSAKTAPSAVARRAPAAAAAAKPRYTAGRSTANPATARRTAYGRRGYSAAPARTAAPAEQSSATAASMSRYSYGPSPDRYKEIQQALSEKGYYKGSVDGTWNAESQEALRRFQADQNLTSTGKLDSLSLIALGLGPKRDSSAQLTTNPGIQGINP